MNEEQDVVSSLEDAESVEAEPARRFFRIRKGSGQREQTMLSESGWTEWTAQAKNFDREEDAQSFIDLHFSEDDARALDVIEVDACGHPDEQKEEG